ncbi:hypothetical protein B0T21DRAFT_412078 [Apiosordaria backusii]|uniref:Uncharacterized protein n=1 Tax=Apiosordaria backusii TaxID=314023 RepID=A0AA40BJS4_9PEZI|nr:hypothetical protein B0T21DRAFT_412078 [Apiosordaria backusii]
MSSSSNPPRRSSSSSSSSSSYHNSSPWKQPPTQPPLRPTYPTSTLPPNDNFSLTMPGIDPLSFFLTPPTPYPEDEAMLDFDFDDYNNYEYDAGIEDSSKHRPTESVRSVSPSSLGGFARPGVPRPPTPPKSAVSSPTVSTPDLEYDYGSLGASPDSDVVMEEYYRHRLGGYGGVPLLLKDFTERQRGSKDVKFSRRDKTRGHYGHHHVWREPSPDVWSIEEKPREEEQLQEEEMTRTGKEMEIRKGRAKGVDIKRAKGKRVRFVLPGEEAGVY